MEHILYVLNKLDSLYFAKKVSSHFSVNCWQPWYLVSRLRVVLTIVKDTHNTVLPAVPTGLPDIGLLPGNPYCSHHSLWVPAHWVLEVWNFSVWQPCSLKSLLCWMPWDNFNGIEFQFDIGMKFREIWVFSDITMVCRLFFFPTKKIEISMSQLDIWTFFFFFSQTIFKGLMDMNIVCD